MKFTLTGFLILICSICLAQEPAPAPPAPDTIKAVNKPAEESAKTKTDSLKMAFTNLKNALLSANKLFTGKADTMTLTILGVDYDNLSLSLLKENIQKMKIVKAVGMTYSSSTAILEIAYKGKPTDIWDSVPVDLRTKFKLTEAGESSILVKYK
jgi:hypothetical protein